MNSIKKGALVKAWGIDPSDFFVGKYHRIDNFGGYHEIMVDCVVKATNAIEIPPELAKQLEEFGNENLRRFREGCGKKLTLSYEVVGCGERQMVGGVVLCKECEGLRK